MWPASPVALVSANSWRRPARISSKSRLSRLALTWMSLHAHAMRVLRRPSYDWVFVRVRWAVRLLRDDFRHEDDGLHASAFGVVHGQHVRGVRDAGAIHPDDPCL